MNFFKRAITSVTRKAGKTTILLALVFVLGNVIAGAVTIEQSIRNTEESVTKGMVPVASIDIDYSKNIDWENPKFITAEQIERLGALSSVEYFDYSDSAGLQSKTMRRYYDSDNDDYYGTRPVPLTTDTAEGEEYEYSEYFSLYGGQSGEILDRKLNKIKIVEGRELNDDEVRNGKNVVVISKKLADYNNLKVGSTFTLETEIWKYDMVVYENEIADVSVDMPYEQQKPDMVLRYEFTIVGLFETVGATSSNPYDIYSYMEAERQNLIYTSNKVIKSINDAYRVEFDRLNPGYDYYSYQYYTPFFVLKSNEDLVSFRRDAPGIMPDMYIVIDNQSNFTKIAAPLKNMSTIATIVLIAGIGASLVILSLLITLFLRERRHEIGIYRSLGERKSKIIGQVLSEVMMISLIAITLALFTGNLISGILSNSMIENQVIAQQQEMQQNPWMMYGDYNVLDAMGYGASITLEDLASQYNVSLGLGIVLTFYGVGILTVLISTLVPILYVLKLNPRKILM